MASKPVDFRRVMDSLVALMAHMPLALNDLSGAPVQPSTGPGKPNPQDRAPRLTASRNIGGLPKHLPREDVISEPAVTACPCCKGKLHPIGQDISEMLDVVPAIRAKKSKDEVAAEALRRIGEVYAIGAHPRSFGRSASGGSSGRNQTVDGCDEGMADGTSRRDFSEIPLLSIADAAVSRFGVGQFCSAPPACRV